MRVIMGDTWVIGLHGNLKTEYKYLSFEMTPKQPKKTSCWVCRNKRSKVALAMVKWYPAWREYCFFPIINDTVFNAGCLKDIADFLGQLMNQRRGGDKHE
jgi:hypothetical protein